MAARSVERKLAAILAADVVGYSRLMGADEAGAQAAETARLSNGEWQPFLSKDAPHHGFVPFSDDDAAALGGATRDKSSGWWWSYLDMRTLRGWPHVKLLA